MIRQANAKDVNRLIPLFCSGAEGVRLKETVCLPENREKLRTWMMQRCTHHLIWVFTERRHIAGMLVLDYVEPRITILYIVVAAAFRGQHRVGPALVRHVQSLPHVNMLEAEARNPHSLKMLQACGFHQHGCSQTTCEKYPRLLWTRG
jgi:ribosomal protein S18 acetylase RimI-like enzyme